MPGLLADADAFLADAAAKARAQDPITARGREVAELVAQALPNREVARARVLSERTVESHVRSILAKTGSNQGPKSPASGYSKDSCDGGMSGASVRCA